MFGKKVNGVNNGETSFKKDIPTFERERNVALNTVTDSVANICDGINTISRMAATSMPRSVVPLTMSSAVDGYYAVRNAQNVSNYVDEMTYLAEDNHFDKTKFIKAVTNDQIRHEVTTFVIRDLCVPVFNCVLDIGFDYDTPLKRAIRYANIPGFLSVGASEGVNHIMDKLDQKNANKNGNKEEVFAIAYRDKKCHSAFAKDQSNKFKRDLLITGITSVGLGVLSYIIDKASAEDDKGSTNGIIVIAKTITSTPQNDNKKPEKTTKTTSEKKSK